MKPFALLVIGGLLLASPTEKKTFIGIITETMCGADHAMMNISPDAKCVVECVKHDKNIKYALLVGKKLYVLSDQQTPEKFAAQKVKITGTLFEKTGILKVDSMELAK